MNDIIVKSVVERLVVTHAPNTSRVSLDLLTAATKGIQLTHDILRIGYPYEEEVAYRIVGFDLTRLESEVERVTPWSGCDECGSAPHWVGYGHCECECHRCAA